MHHLIQHGKVRSQLINVPEGLPELLSDITREVLRCQPKSECLCHFIIDYLHSVIVIRDKAKIAKSIVDRALRVVDKVIADMCICDIPQAKADEMSEAMEECFQRFLTQRRCERGKDKEIIKFNEFDMLDELVRKCKFTDDELKISRPIIETAYQKFVDAYKTVNETVGGADSLYQYFREREIKRMEERLRIEAAVKIQSSFRGFLVRKFLFADELRKKPSPLNLQTEEDKMELDIAARKIQNFFRRYISTMTVKTVHDDGVQLQDPCTPASNLSLPARPADYHDLKEEIIENVEEEKHDAEKYSQDVANLVELVKDEVEQDIMEPVIDNITEVTIEENQEA